MKKILKLVASEDTSRFLTNVMLVIFVVPMIIVGIVTAIEFIKEKMDTIKSCFGKIKQKTEQFKLRKYTKLNMEDM